MSDNGRVHGGILGPKYSKLPDALIAATALCHGLEVLTMDLGLQAILRSGA